MFVLMSQGGANVISTFLRGCCRDDTATEEGDSGFDGKFVDRIVVTIAPMFLQGYNVLAAKAKTACDDAAAAAPGSGAKRRGCYCYWYCCCLSNNRDRYSQLVKITALDMAITVNLACY